MTENPPLTVSAMVELLARETHGDAALFSRIARTLINVGMLPKASGRAVPVVTLEHRARFLLACMATDRASDAPLAMMHRFEAEETRSADNMKAGAFLVEHLGHLADFNKSAWSLWTYSRLDVSRSVPAVTARLNENLAGFSNVEVVQRHFANGDVMMTEDRQPGFEVTASCRGETLVAFAIGLPFIDALSAFRKVHPHE